MLCFCTKLLHLRLSVVGLLNKSAHVPKDCLGVNATSIKHCSRYNRYNRRCVRMANLLRCYRHSGLVMYFSTLPAPSASAPCILAILTHLRGRVKICILTHRLSRRACGSVCVWAPQCRGAWPCWPRSRCRNLRRRTPGRCPRRQECGCRCGRGTSGRG